jgi:hypothetical protein
MLKKDCEFWRICANQLNNLCESAPEAGCIRKIGLFEIAHAVQKMTRRLL